jgi:putative NADH-flavin reductase
VKVVVFGATGKLGAHLLGQGLAKGHAITALVRDPSRLPPRPGLVARRGDVLDPSSVAASVAGQDAALWAVGGHDAVRARLKRETRQPRLCSEGTRNVLAAMDRHGVQRLVAVTSWGLGDAARRVPATYRLLIFPLLLRQENQDKQRQEELIRASQLDWTIVRPSRLTDRPATGGYRVGTRLSYAASASIARADLAAFLLDQLDDHAATRGVVEITT